MKVYDFPRRATQLSRRASGKRETGRIQAARFHRHARPGHSVPIISRRERWHDALLSHRFATGHQTDVPAGLGIRYHGHSRGDSDRSHPANRCKSPRKLFWAMIGYWWKCRRDIRILPGARRSRRPLLRSWASPALLSLNRGWQRGRFFAPDALRVDSIDGKLIESGPAFAIYQVSYKLEVARLIRSPWNCARMNRR